MLRYIGRYHLFCDVAYTRAKITAGPKMLAPVTFAKMRKFLLDKPRTAALDVLGNLTGRQLGRTRNMKVDVVFADMAAQHRDPSGLAGLTDKFADAQGNVSLQYVVTIFRHPNKVILDVVNAMRTFTVFFAHGLNPHGL